MKGQWIGRFEGDYEGRIIVNIDENATSFSCIAYLQPDKPDIQGMVVNLITPDKNLPCIADALISPINRNTGLQDSIQNFRREFPNSEFSNKATIELNITDQYLLVSGLADNNVRLNAKIGNPNFGPYSSLSSAKMSWVDFKGSINEQAQQYIFRGQKKPWKLVTSFHRYGRFIISEFLNKDIPILRHKISSISQHHFDLTIPEQNGAFFNLLQHHGYPTPLLDWTYSPYVAAFFAFQEQKPPFHDTDFARIYVFNANLWKTTLNQIQLLDPTYPHLSISEFLALENPRVIPQQAVTTVTNIFDIESYIMEKENEFNCKFLTAIDIPAKEYNVVMSDLRLMGITSASMFPGIDGICAELKRQMFLQC